MELQKQLKLTLTRQFKWSVELAQDMQKSVTPPGSPINNRVSPGDEPMSFYIGDDAREPSQLEPEEKRALKQQTEEGRRGRQERTTTTASRR